MASYEDESVLAVEDFATRLRSSDDANAVLGAFVADKLVGTLGFYRHRASKANHRASLWGMYVAPEERGATTRQRPHATRRARLTRTPPSPWKGNGRDTPSLGGGVASTSTRTPTPKLAR